MSPGKVRGGFRSFEGPRPDYGTPLPEGPIQAQRRDELLLLRALALSLLFGFRAQIDDAGTDEVIRSYTGPAMSGNRVLREILAEEEAGEAAPLRTPILLVAARWYTTLALPRTLGALWGGPPLRSRTQSANGHRGSQHLRPSGPEAG